MGEEIVKFLLQAEIIYTEHKQYLYKADITIPILQS